MTDRTFMLRFSEPLDNERETVIKAAMETWVGRYDEAALLVTDYAFRKGHLFITSPCHGEGHIFAVASLMLDSNEFTVVSSARIIDFAEASYNLRRHRKPQRDNAQPQPHGQEPSAQPSL